MKTTFPISRWREVLEERVAEATGAILTIDGVVDVVVGGSIGRNEAWPFSDLDLLPITAAGADDIDAPLRTLKAHMSALWASTGWTHVLDVGWLSFTDEEAATVVEGDEEDFAQRLSDPRWLYGTDKAAGGRSAVPGGYGQLFVNQASSARFAPKVRAARFDSWMAIIATRLDRAREALTAGRFEDAVVAAQVGGPLAAAALEAWSEREGSMTRFATHFERVASTRGADDLLAAVRMLSRSDPATVTAAITELPAWLETRIELAYLGRCDVGEDVTAEQNRRDHLLLYLGTAGLPSPAEWILGGALDAPAYLHHASETAGLVQALFNEHITSAQ